MVPCQPRQLVILSLPFAALVAFFWFKRRRSLSRSDPGGTAARQKLGDNTAFNGKLPGEEISGIENLSASHTVAKEVEDKIENTLEKSEEAVKNSLVSKSLAVEEEFVAESAPINVQCPLEKPKQEIVEEVKSVHHPIIPEIKKKEFVCNGSAAHIRDELEEEIENNSVTSDIESNLIFHSTTIESEKNFEESKEDNLVLDNQHIDDIKSIESIPEVKKEEVVCNGTAADTEAKPKQETEKTSLSDIENNRIFHSTIIETEKNIKESKEDNLVLANQQIVEEEDNQKEENCKKQKLNNSVESTCDEKSDNKEIVKESLKRQTIPIEDQSTLEYKPSKKHIEENKPTVDFSIAETTVGTDLNNCGSSSTETLERTENTSIDTGLGSQEPSTVEDCNGSMAQGQKTDEKSEKNATGLEQKLASLGLDTTQQPVQRTERDSANHSPAEVMLNSPAISTFSDAHSEGSSDSGKGCSDVVTPPSRTPAGGSSVAGDLAHSVYEFVLPQVIVGRLIGRHGAFLHDIRAKTHTNVFIKRHPETTSLKICAIEGTQQDIDAALKMIRQKFPLRRFPDLTLEKVSFVKNPCLPFNPENLRLHLVEGVNNDVLLSSLITAGHFFLQMPMHMSYQSLYKLACIMNDVYNTQESPPLVQPQPDVVCVVPAHGGWYRGQILSVDEETNVSEIMFLDYGGYMTMENSCLRQIRGDFLLLPFQAVECVLANVMPAGGEETWSEEATQFVQLMTTNQTLQAQVYDYTDTGLPLVYLYCTQFYQSLTDPSGYETKVVLLNQELVSRGYADLIDSSKEAETSAPTDSS